jgi:hypothetical protein
MSWQLSYTDRLVSVFTVLSRLSISSWAKWNYIDTVRLDVEKFANKSNIKSHKRV